MNKISITFEIVSEDSNKTEYRLIYKDEEYLITALHDGEFHNKIYECSKDIPDELSDFVEFTILENNKKSKGE